MGSGAEMLALTEGDVLVGIALDIEAVGIVEDGLVAICRRNPQRNAVALGDCVIADPRIFRRNARNMRDRTGPPQDLLDRSWQQRRIRGEATHLIGMLN